MRKVSLKIRKVNVGGKIFFQVSVPDPTGNRPKRKTFADRASASAFLDAAKIQMDNFGSAAFSMSDALRADAIRAAELLAPTGASLTDAARQFVDGWQRSQTGKPIREAVDAFLASRSGMSTDYLNTLRPRLEHFAAAAAELTTATIGPDDIAKFLDSLAASPRTVAHHRTHLSALFQFCAARKWSTENPVASVPIPKTSTPEPDILSPADAAAILSACSPAILPGVVLGMFCGLRQAEIERLQWQAVDLAQGIVTIGSEIAKTNSRRVCAIPEAAKAWLAPYAQRRGAIWPATVDARNLWTLARVAVGYGPFTSTSVAVEVAQNDPATMKHKKGLRPWPHNALRHSAISYRVAQERDLAKIAYESGNSPGIIQRHYNGLATPAAAKLFFSIMPETPANVSTFKAA